MFSSAKRRSSAISPAAWTRSRRALYAIQGRGAETLVAERVTQAAWHMTPCVYPVSTQDRTINPDLERFMAKRMKAKPIELNASHLGIISHPRENADLILAAAGHTG
jgi:hypothetical protein